MRDEHWDMYNNTYNASSKYKLVQKEIKRDLNPGNAGYHSIQVPFLLLSAI
jgi:hypothetical protein